MIRVMLAAIVQNSGADMDEVWIKQLSRAVDAEERRMQRLAADVQRFQRELEGFAARAGSLDEAVTAAKDKFAADFATLYERRRDPIVLVGDRSFIYHSSTQPCGQAPSYPNRLLWSEARQDRHLQPCGSCGWRANQEARKLRGGDAG